MTNELPDKAKSPSHRLSLDEVYERIYPAELEVLDESSFAYIQKLHAHFDALPGIIQKLEQNILSSFPQNSKASKKALSFLYDQLLRVADRLMVEEEEFLSAQGLRIAAIVISHRGEDPVASAILRIFEKQADKISQNHKRDIELAKEAKLAAGTNSVALEKANYKVEQAFEALLSQKEVTTLTILHAASAIPLEGQRHSLHQQALDGLATLARWNIKSYETLFVNCAELKEDYYPFMSDILKESFSTLLMQRQNELAYANTMRGRDAAWNRTIDLIALCGHLILFYPHVPALEECAAAAIRHHYRVMSTLGSSEAKETIQSIAESFALYPENDKETSLAKVVFLLQDLYSDQDPILRADAYRKQRLEVSLYNLDQTQNLCSPDRPQAIALENWDHASFSARPN